LTGWPGGMFSERDGPDGVPFRFFCFLPLDILQAQAEAARPVSGVRVEQHPVWYGKELGAYHCPPSHQATVVWMVFFTAFL
jgi:hypothetical protein